MFRAIAALTLLATAAAAQTAPDQPPAPPAAAPAAAPTGDAAQVIAVLDRLCAPALAGGKGDKLAAQMGLRKNRDDDWVLSLGGPKRITVTPPNVSNPDVCSLVVLYDIGGDGPIYTALNNWALAHPNPFVQARNHEASQAGDETRTISTWSAVEDNGANGLLFIQERTADGKPLNFRTDQAQIQFSIRPN
jgi:hypothetical protein